MPAVCVGRRTVSEPRSWETTEGLHEGQSPPPPHTLMTEGQPPSILQWSMLWDEIDTGLETKMKLALHVL